MDSEPRAGDLLEIVIDPGSDLTMSFRWMPPCPEGFLMGSREYGDEQPIHRVILSRGFWLGETLVTQAQFSVWTGSQASEDWLAKNKDKLYQDEPHKNAFDHGAPEKLPADSVSWDEARGFCEWLNEYELTQNEGTTMLPTEAQWEYACRAGSTSEFHNGDGEASLAESGSYNGNAEGKTREVRTKKANDLGLYDMHGNLWEWCRDAWDENAYAKRSKITIDPLVESSEAETKRRQSGRAVFGAAVRGTIPRRTAAPPPATGSLRAFGSGSPVFGYVCFPGPVASNSQTEWR